MVNKTQERKLFEIMTSAYKSMVLIYELSRELEKTSSCDLKEFYKRVTNAPSGKYRDPFDPSLIVMSSYISLVLGKQKWNCILPDEPARSSPEEWEICKCNFTNVCDPNPSLKEVIRRMRNGIAHGRIDCIIPKNLNISQTELLKKTIFIIQDKKNDNAEVTFSIEISALNLWNLNATFFNKIGNYEKNKLNQY
jgi:hypothetical protein